MTAFNQLPNQAIVRLTELEETGVIRISNMCDGTQWQDIAKHVCENLDPEKEFEIINWNASKSVTIKERSH